VLSRVVGEDGGDQVLGAGGPGGGLLGGELVAGDGLDETVDAQVPGGGDGDEAGGGERPGGLDQLQRVAQRLLQGLACVIIALGEEAEVDVVGVQWRPRKWWRSFAW
jgi:hypothetical protein